MFRHLWTEPIGSACIDVSVCPVSNTFAVADVGNRFILGNVDDGKVIFDYSLEMPAWGVSHRQMPNGSWRSAVACADKQEGSGKIVILDDDQLRFAHSLPAPAWDTIVDEYTGDVLVSCWDGMLYIWRGDNPLELTSIEIRPGRALFGLAKCDKQGVCVNVERAGILRVDLVTKQMDHIVDSNTNAYNVSVSADGSRLGVCGHGPNVMLFTRETRVTTRCRARDCYASAFVGHSLLTGERDGTISLWSELYPADPIFAFDVGAEVWALFYNPHDNVLFAALGDGRLSRYELNGDYRDLPSVVADAVGAFNGRSVSATDIIAKHGIIDPVLPKILASLSDADTDDIENGAQFIEAALALHDRNDLTDAHVLLEAAALAKLGRFQEASTRLQALESGSPWYAASIAMLIQSLTLSGNTETAHRVLAANSGVPGLGRYVNIPSDTTSLRPEFDVGRKSPLALSGTIGSDLAEGSGILLLQERKENTARNLVRYDLVNFIKYEYPSDADHAKKLLEHAQVQEILTVSPHQRSGLRSLDIGCATCRYPLWFANQSYFATGYDISDTAIEISTKRAMGYNNIRIQKKNVLISPPEPDTYHVITCMMGTFNHFNLIEQLTFIRWCFASLVPGGLLIFSSWNKECAFNTFLHFYNRDERELLLRNMRTFRSVVSALEENDFLSHTVRPTAFLSDECYNAWVSRIDESTILEIDKKLGSLLNGNEAQMGVFAAVKP